MNHKFIRQVISELKGHIGYLLITYLLIRKGKQILVWIYIHVVGFIEHTMSSRVIVDNVIVDNTLKLGTGVTW